MWWGKDCACSWLYGITKQIPIKSFLTTEIVQVLYTSLFLSTKMAPYLAYCMAYSYNWTVCKKYKWELDKIMWFISVLIKTPLAFIRKQETEKEENKKKGKGKHIFFLLVYVTSFRSLVCFPPNSDVYFASSCICKQIISVILSLLISFLECSSSKVNALINFFTFGSKDAIIEFIKQQFVALQNRLFFSSLNFFLFYYRTFTSPRSLLSS